MKVLFVSLHRLGDLIMHAHVLKAFKEETGHSISLLTHSFFKQVPFLFPFIDEVFIFERELCQRSIGESELNKVWPYYHITELLNKINIQHYDKVIDLSQSETSSRWMTFINAPCKTGVAYNHEQTVKAHCSENVWMRYLHTFSSSQIHFIDLFKKALNLTLSSLPQAVSIQHKEHNKRIVFQTLSSDAKKNWPTFKWIQLIQKVQKEFPDYELIILASSSEWQLLQKSFSDIAPSVQVLNASISEVFALLKEASLLITLDTAIKHLATWAGTPIVELALGSSNPKETGAYQEGALILHPQISCSPCRHSNACSQSSFLCHEDLSVNSVLLAVQLQLQIPGDFKNKNYNPVIYSLLSGVNENLLTPIHYVHTSPGGWWSAQPIQKMENQDARRNQKPIEINYEAN